MLAWLEKLNLQNVTITYMKQMHKLDFVKY